MEWTVQQCYTLEATVSPDPLQNARRVLAMQGDFILIPLRSRLSLRVIVAVVLLRGCAP